MIPPSASGWLFYIFHDTPGSSSTHFPLPEYKSFFRADRSVLLDASALPLLCMYKFFIFNSLQKFLYTKLSNCRPLSVTVDWGIPNLHTMFFHINRMASLSLMDTKASTSIYLMK